MSRIWLAVPMLAALTLTAPRATAQRSAGLVGWIKDSAGTPVGGADVQIQSQKAVTRTDSSGRFSMASLEPGAVTVRIRRLGFDPHTFEVVLHASAVDSVAVTMDQSAQLLDALRTDATFRRQYSALEDFYKRRSRGGGYFVTRDEIEEHHTNVLSDALRQVPGVRIVRGGSARGTLRFNSAGTKAYDCPPQIWVDGRRVRGADVDDFPATDVEGVELYFGPATTPMQFSQGQIASCGTVVIWTRLPGIPTSH